MNDEERIDLYLSGGGFRAALGSIGVLFFLLQERRWTTVRRIVSVSGGGFVNAGIALSQPDQAALGAEIRRQFEWLTSRRTTLLALARAGWPFVLAVGALTWTVWAALGRLDVSTGTAWILYLLVLIFTLLAVAPFFIALWIRRLCDSATGGAKLDALCGSAWHIEHIFVATDLSDFGSFFFVTNGIHPIMVSMRQGLFDARHISFTQALRATTAFPPVVHPAKFRFRQHSSGPSLVEPHRTWVWVPRPGFASTVWLADGGLSGNLGIQLDGAIAPDNVALLESFESRIKAETFGEPGQIYHCPHNEIAWNCGQCNLTRLIVDCSGSAPRRSRWLGVLLRSPLIGPTALSLRSLKVLYESSLADDQYHAGDTLIGVVRSDQMVRRLASKNMPLSTSGLADERAYAAGLFLATCDHFADPALRRKKEGMSRLLLACFEARDEAAKLRTGLTAVAPAQAARIVASGYLNACLNAHGPDAFEVADRGMQALAELLGGRTKLADWWDAVRRDVVAAVNT